MNNYYENETLRFMLRDAEEYINVLIGKVDKLESEIKSMNGARQYWKDKFQGRIPEPIVNKAIKHEPIEFDEESIDEVMEEFNQIVPDFSRLGKPRQEVENFNRKDFDKIGPTGKNRKNKHNFYVGTDITGEEHWFSDGNELTNYIQDMGYASKLSAVTGNVATAIKKRIIKYNHHWRTDTK